ncbi:transcription initiation factor TFIID subunit 12 isoform X2 [Cornus florida]|uniref:transcription initiation factor TFIID subunit 12 isoform X2 n=1 Tax=Cornus florida TaxID=4283 RepID=UPI0028A2763F|nr:transcription initiation factor TFIID subunit 12 isoform X2 [Cornus florida]
MEETTPTPSTPQPTEQPPPSQPPPSSSSTPSPSLPPPSSSLPSASSTTPSSPNPNSNQKPQTPQQQSTVQNPQATTPFNRPWQQPSHFSHFSSSSPSLPPVPPFSAPVSSSISASPSQRGGMAIGVPAHHPSPPTPPTSFSSLNPPSFGQQFGNLGRNAVNVAESFTGSSSSQARQPLQGIQGMATVGSFGSGSQIRPGGIAAHHQQRPVQSSLRPQTTPNNQSPATQNFQGHGLLRVPSVGSPGSPSPSMPQSVQPHNQPWLSSGSQGKPPLPSPSFRPQMNQQSLQQRSHIPQQHHHPLSTASQQQMSSAQQSQHTLPSQPPQEHYGQQFSTSRVPQSIPHQQQITRGNQKPSSHAMVQLSTVQSAPPDKTASAETSESYNRILSKRSIQELVSQIDPSERLDPEVEDILVDIADEFVESITTFGCSLAKHRKSTTLEAKDILLHLERNWNMTLPGFRGDEIKSYRKPVTFIYQKLLI